jgi:hypothetical protein
LSVNGGRPGWSPVERRDLDHVAAVVTEWIEACDSPLYVRFAKECARDREMLAIIARIDNVPPMNLLLGAVKLTLTPADALAAWYPHLAGSAAREVDADAYPAFRAYVLERAGFVEEVGRTRRTQTNEVGRAAAMLPWITAEAERLNHVSGTPGEPVHLVDVGASAGINLCLDRFDYDYRDTTVAARNPGATALTLECENRGGFEIPAQAPAVGTRVGLDLTPLDATDADQAAWLEALVWPEHDDRLARLRAGIAIRRDTDVTMIGGDAAHTLAGLDAMLPPGPLVVFHSVMAYQLDAAQRVALDDAVSQLAATRPVARVAMEPLDLAKRPQIRVGLRLDTAQVVATAHAHGRWIDSE